LSGPDLSTRLLAFAYRMEQKFQAREIKHPGEQSVTHADFDWSGQELEPLEQHMFDEFCEYFGVAKMYREAVWIFLNKFRTGSHSGECVDIANLAFVIDQVADAQRARLA